jgi:hypothetical protein
MAATIWRDAAMVSAMGLAKGRTCARTVALDALAGALESPASQHVPELLELRCSSTCG